MATNEETIENLDNLLIKLGKLKYLVKDINKLRKDLGRHIGQQKKQIAWRKDGGYGKNETKTTN